jgi:glycine/D-amino acid oxidase-like deaminating enzyme
MPSIAVIGAGIIGAALAFRLAETRVEFLLLDRAVPASGATAASYAWINANEKLPRAYYELNKAAMEAYRRLAWRLAPAPWYHADGNLIWFSDPTETTALTERVERLRSWGYAAEILPAQAVLADLEPGLRGGIADQGTPFAWFPEEAWVEAIAMTDRLVEAARNAGGRVLTGPEREVVDIETEDGRVSAVKLRGGQSIAVKAVVNAAGANAPTIAAMVGRILPVAPSPGLVVRATMPDGSNPLRRPVETDHVAVRPDGPGRVLLAFDTGGEGDLADAPLGSLPLDHPLVVRVMTWGAATVPALKEARPTDALVAMRPMPADGYPSVGAVASIPGYFEAVTHSGITLAPLIARSLSDEILGKAHDRLFDAYRPERIALV